MKIQRPPGGHSTQRSNSQPRLSYCQPTKLVYQNPGLNWEPSVRRERSYVSTIRNRGSHCVSHPVCPRSVAWCRGPLPLMSLWFTSAPFCSRNSQAIKEPWQEHRKLFLDFSFALAMEGGFDSITGYHWGGFGTASGLSHPHHSLNQRSPSLFLLARSMYICTMSQRLCHER